MNNLKFRKEEELEIKIYGRGQGAGKRGCGLLRGQTLRRRGSAEALGWPCQFWEAMTHEANQSFASSTHDGALKRSAGSASALEAEEEGLGLDGK